MLCLSLCCRCSMMKCPPRIVAWAEVCMREITSSQQRAAAVRLDWYPCRRRVQAGQVRESSHQSRDETARLCSVCEEIAACRPSRVDGWAGGKPGGQARRLKGRRTGGKTRGEVGGRAGRPFPSRRSPRSLTRCHLPVPGLPPRVFFFFFSFSLSVSLSRQGLVEWLVNLLD